MNDRWQIAIHEAAHGVAAIALGGQCDGLLLYPDGSGRAVIDRLSPTDYAIAIASAALAEEMLDAEPIPDCEIAERLDVRPNVAALTPRETLAFVASRYPTKQTPTDAQLVAQYCIQGIATEPSRWLERYNFVHHVAWRVVTDHRQQILAVARLLFARGVLSQTEIQEAMK